MLVVTLHVSVWVEIPIIRQLKTAWNVTLHVSVWVEIETVPAGATVEFSHAPRERVSWNWQKHDTFSTICQSRSTWACELKCSRKHFHLQGLASRSTWACELKFQGVVGLWDKFASRSTWACELKLISHFPLVIIFKSRSTWACELKWPHERIGRYSQRVTLHVSVWVEITPLP